MLTFNESQFWKFSLKNLSLQMKTVWKILTADNQWKAEWKGTIPSSSVKP